MPIYLAYEIKPEDLTEDKLKRLLNDYFNFDLKERGPRDADEWLEYAKKAVKLYASEGVDLDRIKETPLEKASYLLNWYLVKRHPLLEICIRYHDECPHCPEDFTGLNIWPGHSGSEGIVDLIEFKPEMDAYLSAIGIPYRDRSKLVL